MNLNLISLTEEYIDAFSNKDLKKVATFLTDDFVLEDPIVIRVEGKSKALGKIGELFTSCKTLSFTQKNIYGQNNMTIIEFILKIDSQTLQGVDILEWNGNKIKELRAYLHIPR
ncbi:nuclear transport factor 2 family protein [Maribacter litoralis]|uniref:nuclear transport factor 2 family protein n=1 Tax=Maribacter litoralis TaxID=2059726 RepID=UPI003D2D7C39